MRFLIAPDSFKGSLSAREIIDIVGQEAQAIFPDCQVTGLPMADGGEGTMSILADICQGQYHEVIVHGPLGEERTACYAVLPDGTAIIEMAAASGLPMVPPDMRDPEKTSTYGTGELIRAALGNGCRKFVIGVGGSATNDGGMGAMAALGARFLDPDGGELLPVGGNLGLVARIDMTDFDPAAAQSDFTVMCDIDNPLIGPQGATYVFGPQKGAGPQQLERLEAGMRNYAAVLAAQFGCDPSDMPGAGAAGGLAAGLMAFLKAQLSSGIQTVLKLSEFEKSLDGVNLVITGEGRADSQSAHGKVLWGVGTVCKAHGIPAVAIVGSMGEGYEELYGCGIDMIFPTVNSPMTVENAMEHARELMAEAAGRLFYAVSLGRALPPQS